MDQNKLVQKEQIWVDPEIDFTFIFCSYQDRGIQLTQPDFKKHTKENKKPQEASNSWGCLNVIQSRTVLLVCVQKLWGLRTQENLSKLYKKYNNYRNPSCTNLTKFRSTDSMVIQWLCFPGTRGTRGLQSHRRQSLHPCQAAKGPSLTLKAPQKVPETLYFSHKNSFHFYM